MCAINFRDKKIGKEIYAFLFNKFKKSFKKNHFNFKLYYKLLIYFYAQKNIKI